MVVPSSSVNMERLKDRNIELYRLFVYNTIVKSQEKYSKNLRLTSTIMLRKLRQRQKNGFLIKKKTCIWITIATTVEIYFQCLFLTHTDSNKLTHIHTLQLKGVAIGALLTSGNLVSAIIRKTEWILDWHKKWIF